MYSFNLPGASRIQPRSYFTDFTCAKGFFYLFLIIYVAASLVVIFVEPFMDMSTLCTTQPATKEFPNPDFDAQMDLCRRLPLRRLMYMSQLDCDHGRRVDMSILGGSVIGWERRMADRPAGIRTMALVSLGSCLFTICSAYAFMDGSMAWDASRVAAAIPSGVGFLGAGLIWKEVQSAPEEGGSASTVVHGLTTAASLWVSAAVGVACGGRLYFIAAFTIAIMLLLLRFGPRLDESSAEESPKDRDDDLMRPSPTTYNSVEQGDNRGHLHEMSKLSGGMHGKLRRSHSHFDI
jgi:uncharacterized membrane protein YhiD involved in acid resistance